MSQHLVATNGFMAFIWLILTIVIATMLGPAITAGMEGDPEVEAIARAIVGPTITAAILLLVSYIAAAVGTGLEQPWGKGLTMMLLPVTTLLTFPLFFIAIWQTIVLLRRPA